MFTSNVNFPSLTAATDLSAPVLFCTHRLYYNERQPVLLMSSSEGEMAKIYISSTYTDLKDCRESVYRTLRQLGHDVIAMEDYVATDNRPLDKCLADVGTCDLYIGIFAWRYGYIPENDNTEKRSVTEFEYRHAGSTNIPRLIFLLQEDAPWPRSHMERGDGAERIETLRSELAKEHTLSFFSNHEELARLVAVAVSNEIGDEPGGSQTTAIPPLHQLPPPPPDFTGRRAELQELMEAITEDGITISGLQGQGGIGKTALALVLADRLKGRYADAQFYLDLRGVDANPVSVTDAMAHVVRGFHPTALIPEDEANMRALYVSVLDGKRAILLMDNARDRAQVEPLMPPSSCLLLVTSRQHFVLPGLIPIDLDTLPPTDAESLIVTIAPRAEEQAGVIAQLCGYLPHALRVAASLLAERIDLAVDDYVGRLRDSSNRLDLIDASLTLSYDLLSSELQRLWRTLAVFPVGFDVGGASAVWEMDADATQDRLGEFMRYSLVQWSEASGRYSLHDLARVYADSRLEGGERLVVEELHSAHYLEVLSQADDLYKEGGDSVLQGLGLFDAELDNIRVGQGWAADHSAEGGRAAELCSRYGYAGAYIFLVRLHPRERIRWMEAGLDAARRLSDKNKEGATLSNLGLAHHRLGEYSKAIEYHEQRLIIAREIGSRSGEGTAFGNLGMAYSRIAEYTKAIEYLEQHLAIAREIGDKLGEGNSLGNLGSAYYGLGKYTTAIDYYEQSLTITRDIGDRLGESHVLGNLGNAYYNLGEHTKAIDYYEQHLAIAREIGDRPGEGNALNNMALSLDEQGDRVAAIERAEAALVLYH